MARNNLCHKMITHKCPALAKAKSKARRTRKDSFMITLKTLKKKWQNQGSPQIVLKLKGFSRTRRLTNTGDRWEPTRCKLEREPSENPPITISDPRSNSTQ